MAGANEAVFTAKARRNGNYEGNERKGTKVTEETEITKG
jgi:hypothetical protein